MAAQNNNWQSENSSLIQMMSAQIEARFMKVENGGRKEAIGKVGK